MELQVIEPEKKQVKFDDDPLISFIVPVHANNLEKSILKRCLMSLDEQDYANMEVVIVVNGGKDKGLEDTAQFFVDQNPEKFKLVQIDEGGACHARNVGFEHSKGEIVSFFNSDYRAKPGMTRMWVDALIENKDCGFAYGGYEYATAPAVAYWSKKFDPYQLTQANYIDCGFPLWRKYVVKWDPDVKSLQDWDFWMRVVKDHKIKGFFIERDLSFIAEKPRPKGLTEDSSNNWVERVKFIRDKNGVPTSDLVVTSLGAGFHGVQIAQMLGADYRDDTIFKPNNYKAVYLIGFYLKPTDTYNGHGQILGSFGPDVKKIIHFVGADIYWLRKFPYESLKFLSGVIKMGADHVLSENEMAQKELREFGIESKIVPIPTYNDYELRMLPPKFKVAIYLTGHSDFDKYLQTHSLSIVRAMPDVEFSGYGDAAKDYTSPNFKHYGNMDNATWKGFVYDHSCVLRLVRHDTLPMAPCDFLLAGRETITNIPMDYAHVIDTGGKEPLNSWDIFAPGFNDVNWPDTKTKIIQKIREVKRICDSGKQNKEARAHYLKILDRQKYIDTIMELSGLKGGTHA